MDTATDPSVLDPSTYALTDDYAAQADLLAQRKALLQRRLLQSAAGAGLYATPSPTSTPGFRSAVTGADFVGTTRKAPLLAQLTPLIAQAGDAADQSSLTRDTSAYNKAVQDDAMRRLQAMPQGTPYSATPTNAPSDTNPNGNYVEADVHPATAPTLRDQITWAMGLTRNPTTAPLGQKYIENQLVTLPQKQAEQVIEYLKLAEQQRYHTGELSKPIPVPQVGLFKPSGFDDKGSPTGWSMVQDTQPPAKPLPEEAMKTWRENNVQMGQIDDAIKLLSTPAGRNATGLWQGAVNSIPGIGTQALNLFDPDGKATRALVGQIASMKIKNTSGQAVSVNEESRLKPWVPQVGDDTDTVLIKLQGFKREYQKMQDEIAQQASDQGYKPPTSAGAQSAPPASRAPARPSAAPAAAPSGTPLPTTLEDYEKLSRQAKERYLQSPTPANKRAMEEAMSDVTRFQSQGNTGSSGQRAWTWNPSTQRLE